MANWFTIDKIDDSTFVISEDQHWEHPHCYLLLGEEAALLIDTGLGIADIRQQVASLTAKPIIALATHVHWDHIGGHGLFPTLYVHQEEADWLQGAFPLPLALVKAMVARDCRLPEDFDLGTYQVFQGNPARCLRDGDTIDLGGRVIKVCHTPGHSPGHMCLYEAQRGYLFAGDLVYSGTLFMNYPSTDPAAYLASINRIAVLPVKRVFPGHHGLELPVSIIGDIQRALRDLDAQGRLHHGAGQFDYQGFSCWL